LNNRSLLILVALVFIAGLVAVQLSREDSQSSTEDELFLPQLSESLNEVRQISVLRGGNRVVATLVRGDDQWTVAEANNYPADLARIRQNLIALSTAKVIETKTAKPELHGKLGVEDIQQENATGTLLKIEGIAQEPVAIIIGQSGVGGGSMSYARRVGDDQSLMIAAEFDLGSDESDWLDRQVIDISSGKIFSVTVSAAEGAIFRIEKSSRDSTDFELVDMPANRELQFAGAPNAVGAALSELQLDNVEPEDAFEAEDSESVLSRFENFDGLVIESRAWKTGEGTRVQFVASVDEELANRFRVSVDGEADSAQSDTLDAVKKEADRINERLAGWVYTLPGYKADQLIKSQEDLLKPVDP
jgi:hypothetical protein